MTPEKTVIALEIGGTKLQAALALPDGRLIALRRGNVDQEAGAEGILAWFDQEIPGLLAASGRESSSPGAIGVGFGGPVDTVAGTVLTSHQIAGWQGFALRQWFEDRFKLPTVLENDANAAGWGEYCLGAGRGCSQFIYSNIGSGIGGAFVLGGRLYNGQGLGAAEIGHTLIADWTAGTPGAVARFEDLCSGWAIERRLRSGGVSPRGTALWDACEGRAERLTCADLAAAARTGDVAACAEIDRIACGMGQALANVITLLHPERIALGGGVSLMGEVLLEPLRRYVDQFAFGPYRGSYEIVACQRGESVVLDGALLLAFAHLERQAA